MSFGSQPKVAQPVWYWQQPGFEIRHRQKELGSRFRIPPGPLDAAHARWYCRALRAAGLPCWIASHQYRHITAKYRLIGNGDGFEVQRVDGGFFLNLPSDLVRVGEIEAEYSVCAAP